MGWEWQEVIGRRPRVKDIFYKAAFVQMFSRYGKASGADSITTLHDHGRILARVVDEIVADLPNSAALMARVAGMGKAHAFLQRSGLKAEVWESFGESALEVLAGQDCVKSSVDAVRGWTILVACLTDELRWGFEQGCREADKKAKAARKAKAQSKAHPSSHANGALLPAASPRTPSAPRPSPCDPSTSFLSPPASQPSTSLAPAVTTDIYCLSTMASASGLQHPRHDPRPLPPNRRSLHGDRNAAERSKSRLHTSTDGPSLSGPQGQPNGKAKVTSLLPCELKPSGSIQQGVGETKDRGEAEPVATSTCILRTTFPPRQIHVSTSRPRPRVLDPPQPTSTPSLASKEPHSQPEARPDHNGSSRCDPRPRPPGLAAKTPPNGKGHPPLRSSITIQSHAGNPHSASAHLQRLTSTSRSPPPPSPASRTGHPP